MPGAPELKQFRIEWSANRVVHLVFDMPGRSMNVFSNAAIEELGRFADWLPQSDVAGVVIRSGKSSACCVGADLAELETAYDMVMAAPTAERDGVALDHLAEPGVAQARDRGQARRGSDRGTGFGRRRGVCACGASQGPHRSPAEHVWPAGVACGIIAGRRGNPTPSASDRH